MSYITYELVHDPEIQAQVEQRYAEPIAAVRALGFDDLVVYSEVTFPGAAVLLYPILSAMRKHQEVVRLRSGLRFATSYPLLLSRRDATFALLLGLGTKFYTQLTDGTVLITGTSEHGDIANAAQQVYKYMGLGSLEKAWEAHQAQIKARTTEGLAVAPVSGIGDYVEMSNREEVASGGSSVIRIALITMAALLLPLILVIQCLLIWLRIRP